MEDPLSFALGKFGEAPLQKYRFLYISPLLVTQCSYEAGEIKESKSYGLGNISKEFYKTEDYDFSVVDNTHFEVSNLKSIYYAGDELLEIIFAGLFSWFDDFVLKKGRKE